MRGRANYRQRVDAKCAGCGIWGHDIFSTGCDFTASLINAQKFLEKYPKTASKLLAQQSAHQSQRKSSLSAKVSTRFQAMAKKKNIKFGPNINTLMDVLGDTMDTILCEAIDDDETTEVIDFDNTTFSDDDGETYHDPDQQEE